MHLAITGGSLIQSTFGSGNFEAVVFDGPRTRGDDRGELWHYWRDTSRYQLASHTTRTRAKDGGDAAALYYVLSTWNPYPVVQMRHVITIAELTAMG